MAPLARLARLKTRLRQLPADTSAMGAVEFALIVPLLLLLYLGAFELTLGLSTAKRTASASGAVADIVARQVTSVQKSFLATMPDVVTSIFAPQNVTGYTLKISGIQVDASNKATIAWSWAADNTRPYTVNSTWTMPTGMSSPSTFFVHAELSVPHRLITYFAGFTGSSVATVNIYRDYYFRQRDNGTISCSDC